MKVGEPVGMTISAEGVFGRAADQCKRSRDNKHLEWPLLELLKHLNEMYRRRHEPEVIDEFFRVWSVEAKEIES